MIYDNCTAGPVFDLNPISPRRAIVTIVTIDGPNGTLPMLASRNRIETLYDSIRSRSPRGARTRARVSDLKPVYYNITVMVTNGGSASTRAAVVSQTPRVIMRMRYVLSKEEVDDARQEARATTKV